ncbi:SRPBCC family protein [Geobacter sp. SVR]|uniref:SRPBCC family protein n=1 Tax=Geobacter sp. SVR TaxID=2495594 RepID=UPI001564FB98|nr:SRPBCC family protein [Geobacter sp. SVR]
MGTGTSTVPGQGAHNPKRRINVGRDERNVSMFGGAALALTGLKQLSQRKVWSGVAMMAAGSMFLYRGKTGHCDVYQAIGIDRAGTEDNGLTVEKVVTINRQPREVYEYWHDFENLPRFMKHLELVRSTGATTSHWKARGPGDITVEWDAEMIEDRPGQRISWHSGENADIPNQGEVEFHQAPAGRGTELKVRIRYYPPGGMAGKAAATVAHQINAQQVEEDLRRLKQILETGETATAERYGIGRTFH